MSVDPVIVDDGGSTRIKHVRSSASDVGAMESLVNVQPGGGGAQSSHTFSGASVGGFTRMQVVYLDQASGNATPTTRTLAPGDKVEIVSGAMKVTLDVGSTSSTLTVFGPTANEPVVESKQAKVKAGGTRRQRRYVVSNAPPIDTVTHTSGGTSTVVFDSSTVTSVYTMVHFT
jgi:hypothetical protein